MVMFSIVLRWAAAAGATTAVTAAAAAASALTLASGNLTPPLAITFFEVTERLFAAFAICFLRLLQLVVSKAYNI